MAASTEIREFLASRRARITPGQAGLPAYGGNRRVKGLRREEVALLAGVSGERLVPRASFFQLQQVRKARAAGLPLRVIAHEDVLVLRKP